MVFTDPTVHVMSFNIRCDTGKTLPGEADYWPERAPLVKQFLRETQPSILGVQELMHHMIPTVQEGLSSKYAYVGESRDSSAGGELGPIFYNTERFHLNHWDQMWLSDTPTVPESITWGNDVTRIVTWAELTDKFTGRTLKAVNTHFDHKSEYSRVRSAEMLANMFGGGSPVVLMGDFNADSSYGYPKEYEALTGAFQDTLDFSQRQANPNYGTFSNYEEPDLDAKRIDWILSDYNTDVKETSTHTFNVDGRYPSDHLPISAVLSLN